jgi:splicing suppressor protein 51
MQPMSLRLLCVRQGSLAVRRPAHSRTLFNFLKRSSPGKPQEPVPILSEDNLFHSFSQSPFPAVRARGEAIQQLAPCPVCASSLDHIHGHTKARPRAVNFECPECGWPTHCSDEHWKDDTEHKKYCSRLREANEDEHDLRSGRRMREFELPGMIFSVDRTCFAHSQRSRSSRIRGSSFFRQLGRILVHARFSFHGYRAL